MLPGTSPRARRFLTYLPRIWRGSASNDTVSKSAHPPVAWRPTSGLQQQIIGSVRSAWLAVAVRHHAASRFGQSPVDQLELHPPLTAPAAAPKTIGQVNASTDSR